MLETRGETWIFLCVYKEILTLCTLLLVILKLFTFVLTHMHMKTHTHMTQYTYRNKNIIFPKMCRRRRFAVPCCHAAKWRIRLKKRRRKPQNVLLNLNV